MNKKDAEYLKILALMDLKTYHYKILLILNSEPQNQAQIAKILNIQKQNIYKYIKYLERLNLIEVDRVEGKNKFYRIISNSDHIKNVIPGQIKIL